MNKRRKTSTSIGFSSIMVIFITICLVTFATLSVLTANSDYRLSKKTEEKTTAYYEADANAQNMLHEIDQALVSLYKASTDEQTYFENITTNITFFELPTGVQNFSISSETVPPTISYEVVISDIQILYVTLEVQYPLEGNDGFYKITQWQTQTSAVQMETDNHLHLFGG